MQGHQVLEVHTQHRQPEACAASPGAAVTGIVVVGSEELSQLQQGLCGRPCYRRGWERGIIEKASYAPLAPGGVSRQPPVWAPNSQGPNAI